MYSSVTIRPDGGHPSADDLHIHKHWTNTEAMFLNRISPDVYANMWPSSIYVHDVLGVTNEQQQELPALHASFSTRLPNSICSAQG